MSRNKNYSSEYITSESLSFKFNNYFWFYKYLKIMKITQKNNRLEKDNILIYYFHF